MDPISSQGRIFFQCPVVNQEADPTLDVVAIAFLSPDSWPDGTETWNVGSWDTENSNSPVYLAQVLVGLSPAVVLAKGDYDAFVRVTDSPESPVLGPYRLTVK